MVIQGFHWYIKEEFSKIFKGYFIETATKLSGKLEHIFLTLFSANFIL